jgi:hypothetical protein
MGKFVSGFPTKASLKQWSTYGQLGTEAEKPTCQHRKPVERQVF